MLRILVPTDFSSTADNALQYAIEIAATFQSELHLCHAYSISKVDYNLNYSEEDQPYRKTVERRMQQTKNKFLDQFNEKGIKVHTQVTQESIYTLFSTDVLNKGIDLIVMGSKGASGLSKMVFGSVAASVMEIAKIPVIVVPPGCHFSPLRHLVLAVDGKQIAPSDLQPFELLVKKYGAKATLLNVQTANKAPARIHGVPKLEGIETIYREIPMNKSITETINNYITQEECDLLCMVRREKRFWESLFQKSTTKAQVYISAAPLLVLPEKS
jgi:nucleotide-binding universal stress UspA family protein